VTSLTEVTLDKAGERYSVIAVGHADTEAACAAVSTLIFTLAGYLHNIPCRIMEEKLDSGDAKISWRGRQKDARCAFDMAAVGFMQLAQSYPTAARVVRRYRHKEVT